MHRTNATEGVRRLCYSAPGARMHRCRAGRGARVWASVSHGRAEPRWSAGAPTVYRDDSLQRRQYPIGVTQVWRTACAFPKKEKDGCMNLFTIIGVVVVVLFIVGYLKFY